MTFLVPISKAVPGVVMWHIKQGISVPVSVMTKTIKDLENETIEFIYDETGFETIAHQPVYNNAAKRMEAINCEIKMLNYCIETGNVTLTGVLTLFESMMKHQ